MLITVVLLMPIRSDADLLALTSLRIVGDSIPEPLGGAIGDATRGRAVLMSREAGNCLICHQLAALGERFQGEIGPALDGVGGRLDAGQIRLRLVDQSRINPQTLMPPYFRIDGLTRVGTGFVGKPALSAQEIEDLVAYLVTVK